MATPCESASVGERIGQPRRPVSIANLIALRRAVSTAIAGGWPADYVEQVRVGPIGERPGADVGRRPCAEPGGTGARLGGGKADRRRRPPAAAVPPARA